MTPERAKELLPIITAFVAGKTIQWQSAKLCWFDAGTPNLFR